MFHHRGKNRTYSDNLYLAAILSFIAGIVNISGVLSIHTLTTNVTGHFAFFSEELAYQRYASAFVFLLFILSFLFGSFVAGFSIEIISRRKPIYAYAIPILFEILILGFVGWRNSNFTVFEVNSIACILLFAMGMQNSLVTHISQARVRTTHLTGLFTDLGIELSQISFYKKNSRERMILSKNINLRVIIISLFFLGCIMGGFSFNRIGIRTLFLASVLLFIALLYDIIRIKKEII